MQDLDRNPEPSKFSFRISSLQQSDIQNEPVIYYVRVMPFRAHLHDYITYQSSFVHKKS